MKKDFRVSRSKVNENMSDEEFIWEVIEPIWPGTPEDLVDELKRISDGTPGERAIFTATLFIREVDNGGLSQYFGNSSGIFAEEVLQGLKLLGMEKEYNIFQKACSYFPDGKVPTDYDQRLDYLIQHEQDEKSFFSPLEQELFGEERFYPFFRRYIDTHPQEFFFD
jgi:hypothetical protein